MVKHTQTIRRVFDSFVGLALQGLMERVYQNSNKWFADFPRAVFLVLYL